MEQSHRSTTFCENNRGDTKKKRIKTNKVQLKCITNHSDLRESPENCFGKSNKLKEKISKESQSEPSAVRKTKNSSTSEADQIDNLMVAALSTPSPECYERLISEAVDHMIVRHERMCFRRATTKWLMEGV